MSQKEVSDGLKYVLLHKVYAILAILYMSIVLILRIMYSIKLFGIFSPINLKYCNKIDDYL